MNERTYTTTKRITTLLLHSRVIIKERFSIRPYSLLNHEMGLSFLLISALLAIRSGQKITKFQLVSEIWPKLTLTNSHLGNTLGTVKLQNFSVPIPHIFCGK